MLIVPPVAAAGAGGGEGGEQRAKRQRSAPPPPDAAAAAEQHFERQMGLVLPALLGATVQLGMEGVVEAVSAPLYEQHPEIEDRAQRWPLGRQAVEVGVPSKVRGGWLSTAQAVVPAPSAGLHACQPWQPAMSQRPPPPAPCSATF